MHFFVSDGAPGPGGRMNDQLELLLKLQVIDYDIGELERSKEYLPDMIENLNHEIEETRQKLAEAKNAQEEARVRQGALELEIKSQEGNLQKYQQQMMSIKTNKEYDALVSEIDSLKESLSNNETELLQTLETSEELEKQIGEFEEKAEQVAGNNEQQLEILRQKIDSIGDTMSTKEKARSEVMQEIPRTTLSVYERVRRGRGGQAVVAVKRRACGACFKALTPRQVQQVKSGDRVYTCDHCGAIIFWDDPVSD
jgi:predicted  nucleic acid-binding Zn-ribbon protein